MSSSLPALRDHSLEPVVIGATGGSGTRIFVRLLRRAGVFMGANRNPAEDSRDFLAFYDRWINRLAAREGALDAGDQRTADDEFHACVATLRSALDDPQQRWGWKEPRSVFLLPFFHRHFPAMRFVHVVRDGRDMAFSINQNQLRKHGRVFLRDTEAALSPALRSILLWSRNNVTAADYGETRMPESYLRVRFEDTCADPVGVTRSLFDFLGLESSLDASTIALSEVAAPPSLGRWRREHRGNLSPLPEEVLATLRRFGFPDE